MVAMSVVPKPIQFRVLYKFPKMPPVQAHYTAASCPDLMKMLSRTENVSEETVDFMYIHETMIDGSVLEHIAIDNMKKALKSSVQSNVNVLLTAAKELKAEAKAHMRYNTQTEAHHRQTDGWDWYAYPAPYWQEKPHG